MNKQKKILTGAAILLFLLGCYMAPYLVRVDDDPIVGRIAHLKSGSLTKKPGWYWGMGSEDFFFAPSYMQGEKILGTYKIVGRFQYKNWLPYVIAVPLFEMYYLLDSNGSERRIFVDQSIIDLDCKPSREKLGMLCVTEDVEQK